MKKIQRAVILVSILFMILASCTTFQLSGSQVTREIPSYDTVGQFDIKVTCHEFLGTSGGANLFNATSDAMDTAIYDAIQREIQKFTGDAAMNVEITYTASFTNILINCITFGLYAPATAHVTGVIVKYD